MKGFLTMQHSKINGAPDHDADLEGQVAAIIGRELSPDLVTLSPERKDLERALNAAAQDNLTGLIDVSHVETTIMSLQSKAIKNIERIDENERSVTEQYNNFMDTAKLRRHAQEQIVNMTNAALGANTPTPTPENDIPKQPRSKNHA